MKRRAKREINVPVASMSDIAFLLIIFFVLCSNFGQKVAVQLRPPQSPDVAVMQETQLSVAISQDGRIYVHNREMPDAEAVEWAIAALLKDRKTQDQRTVMFKCDSEISKEVFEPVLEAIAKGGGLIGAVGESGTAKRGSGE